MSDPSRVNPADLAIKYALREDVGLRDITTSAIIPKTLLIRAEIEARESGVLCGIEVAEKVFRHVDENIRFLPVSADGDLLEKGREIAYIQGPAASILVAERTALNFLQRLSGIATLTRKYVDKIAGTGARILDTRKTTPNLRALEKYAVKIGGGRNHRFGLMDQVLIKDNHLRILRNESIPQIVQRVRQASLRKTVIGIEVKNLKELAEALKTDVQYILLDNMDLPTVREAVQMRARSAPGIELEVSGGISLENVRAYAECGVERISVGRLTYGAPALDMALDIVG
ncbi:MAG: putative nicotinate-nucleotide pyrophosphorylase [carboxylating] [Candidatus Omnitrophica bacterium]|nr:putative nicotinate-nucleotide pyrophosphorylase [carboxylating] [Candidatus Omnitrophota bacterium]